MYVDLRQGQYRYAHTVETRDFLRALTESAEHRALRISANAQYWRAQLGTYLKERVINGDPELTVVTEEPVPYSADRMKPKRSSAREGRVNPKGIPCLYLATTKETALAEMRPYLGALLSLAMLQTDRELRVVDVSVDHDKRLTRDLLLGNPPTEEITAGIWSQVDQAFAEPVNADDDSMASYAPTQIMAEALRQEEFDGVLYKSRLGPGCNLALFDLDSAHVEEVVLCRATGVEYKFAGYP